MTERATVASLKDHAGLIQARKARQTGRVVSVYTAEGAALDPGAGEHATPYYTVCEDHATCIGHKTRALACSHASSKAGQ